MQLGDAEHSRVTVTNFLVVEQIKCYNAILGRPTICIMKMIVSPYHLMAKFPTDTGTTVLNGIQEESRKIDQECVEKKTNLLIENTAAPEQQRSIDNLQFVPYDLDAD